MNLAKIRQKARNLQGSTTIDTWERRQTSENRSEELGAGLYPEPCLTAQETTHSRQMDAGLEAAFSPLPVATVRAPHVNPLELILTGRQVANCGEDLLDTIDESVETASDYEEYLSVRVADEIYGIHIMKIKEIIRPREVTELPMAPGFLTGFISLRGMIVPVIDMLGRLGLKGEPDPNNQRIVVIRAGDGFAGLLVEEVIQVVRLAIGGIEPASNVLEGIDRDFVNGIGRFDGRIIILLNLENIADINLY